MEPLRFRPLDAADGELIHRLHGDPTTNEHNPFGASADRDASEAMLERWLQHWREEGFGYELAFMDDLVGVGGARRDVWMGHAVVNLYWRLLPEYWGRGLASALAERALVVARTAPRSGDEPIVARMTPENGASARVAERLGLERMPALDGSMAGVEWIVFGVS